MLNAYIKDENREMRPAYRPVVENAIRLLNAAREAEVTVVYIYGNHRPDEPMPSS